MWTNHAEDRVIVSASGSGSAGKSHLPSVVPGIFIPLSIIDNTGAFEDRHNH